MDENRVVSLRQKGAIDDPLTEILRAGARRLIAQAVEASKNSHGVGASAAV
jgi:putative transposase